MKPLEIADHPDLSIEEKVRILNTRTLLKDRFYEPIENALARAKQNTNNAQNSFLLEHVTYAVYAVSHCSYENVENTAYTVFEASADAAYAAIIDISNDYNCGKTAYLNEKKKYLKDIRQILTSI